MAGTDRRPIDPLHDDDLAQLNIADMWRVIDAGPLNGPIESFSLRRNRHYQLILKTTARTPPEDDEPQRLAGTIFSPDAEVVLGSVFKRVVLKGVLTVRGKEVSNGYTQTSRVNAIECLPAEPPADCRLIEWITNFGDDMLPQMTMQASTEDTEVRFSDHLILRGHRKVHSGLRFLPLNLKGTQLYLGLSGNRERRGTRSQGFIVYQGIPSEAFRLKVRNCLSFAFGRPLLALGYRLLGADSEHLGFRVRAGFPSDALKALYPSMPLAHLYGKYADAVVDQSAVERLVGALFENYDLLDFEHVSWLYWHARESALHSQPVQIGAAIEAMQAKYREKRPDAFKTALLDEEKRDLFLKEYGAMLDKLNIEEVARDALKQKGPGLNQPSQRVVNERFFEHLKLTMGLEERGAWKRRNDSAHGNPIKDYPAFQKDVRLLMNLYGRVVLALSRGSDTYVDRFSLRFPIRKLADPVSAPEHLGFTR